MTINTERDIEANLQIGPTDRGMVRLYVEAPGVEIPMDFDPEEAEEDVIGYPAKFDGRRAACLRGPYARSRPRRHRR